MEVDILISSLFQGMLTVFFELHTQLLDKIPLLAVAVTRRVPEQFPVLSVLPWATSLIGIPVLKLMEFLLHSDDLCLSIQQVLCVHGAKAPEHSHLRHLSHASSEQGVS